MALSEDLMSKCSEHLSAYKSACEDHPNLKSFDSSLQQRTKKVIDSVTAGTEIDLLLSQHAIHMEVSQHLLEVSQDVANFILVSEDDVWENKTLKDLVKAYFENTKKTLEIFDNVKECVEKARMGQLVIKVVVAQFDKESAEKDVGGKKKKYERTLKKLKKFKAMGDPFDGREFNTQFKLIQKQQELLLEEVCEAKKKIDEEIKKLEKEYTNAHPWSFYSNVLFGAVFAVVAIGSIALIATGVGAPLGVAGLLSLPVLAMGWVDVHYTLENQMDALKKHADGLKRLEEKVSSVDKGVETNEVALETVSELVHKLEKKISSILKYVDDAIENEEDEVDTKLDLHAIREKVKKLTEKIKEVGETVSEHSKLILEARYHVLEKINDGSGKYHRV